MQRVKEIATIIVSEVVGVGCNKASGARQESQSDGSGRFREGAK